MINFGPDEEFIKNYKKLKSSRKMGELYNCNRKSITAHAKKIGYNYSGNKEIKITNIPIEQVIKDYEELKSAKKVSQKYNCSETAVLNYLKQNGYKPKNHNIKLANVSPEDFINNYDNLQSARKMSELYSCSSTAILNYAHSIGYDVNSNKNYKLSENDKREIIKAYQTDITSTELAKKYQVSRGMITKLWYDTNLAGKENKGGENAALDLTGQHFGKWEVLEKTDQRNAAGAIYWKCKCECGIIKNVLGTSLSQGLSLSCGSHANISKGNEKIKKILQEANIPFEIEKKFSSCKDKKELPFDFYVNNSYLIEYDGEQHFDKDSRFDYEYTHAHDLIKNEWCKNNKILLIRIPYTHFKDLTLKDLLIETSKFVIK